MNSNNKLQHAGTEAQRLQDEMGAVERDLARIVDEQRPYILAHRLTEAGRDEARLLARLDEMIDELFTWEAVASDDGEGAPQSAAAPQSADTTEAQRPYTMTDAGKVAAAALGVIDVRGLTFSPELGTAMSAADHAVRESLPDMSRIAALSLLIQAAHALIMAEAELNADNAEVHHAAD